MILLVAVIQQAAQSYVESLRREDGDTGVRPTLSLREEHSRQAHSARSMDLGRRLSLDQGEEIDYWENPICNEKRRSPVSQAQLSFSSSSLATSVGKKRTMRVPCKGKLINARKEKKEKNTECETAEGKKITSESTDTKDVLGSSMRLLYI